MKRVFFFVCAGAALLLLAGREAQAQASPSVPSPARLPDDERLPLDHWAYGNLQHLRFPGRRITAYGNELPKTPPLTRVDLARATAREWERFEPKLRGRVPVDRQTLGYLGQLVQEFAPELKTLGVNASAAEELIKTAKASDPFPDVPRSHWAYSSVERLRKTGTIIGYANGTFHSP